MENILITGSCGCIGNALKAKLQTGFDEVDFVLGCDHRDIVGRTGTLIHLSSWSEQGESLKRPVKYLDNNLTAFAMILANNAFKRVIFPSSNAVYDPQGNLEPSSVYGLTKLAGEKLIKMYCDQYWILRFANIYGLHDHRSVFYLLSECKKKGKVFTIYEQSGMVRDYLRVSDVANLIDYILKGNIKTGIYNVGTGRGICITTVLKKLCEKHDIKYKCVKMPKGITNGYIPTDNLLKLESYCVEDEFGRIYLN